MSGIIVTLRPSHLPYLRELKQSGMTMARLNGSHNAVNWHRQTIQAIRSTIPDTPILLDMPGRKLRLDIDRIIPVHTDEILDFHLPDWIPEGTSIVFDDGKFTGTVILDKNAAHDRGPIADNASGSSHTNTKHRTNNLVKDVIRLIQFHQDGQLRPQIGMNIPGIPLHGPFLTARDLEIINLAQTEIVDYIGLSFIESAQLIRAVRQICDRPCAVKIETQLAIQNLNDICQNADMVIVARGDLSVECGLFNIIKNQKQILKVAKKHNKTSVVGTGLLALYPPQQSTIADIQNAVLDGADHLLVSGDLPDGENSINAIHDIKLIVNKISC